MVVCRQITIFNSQILLSHHFPLTTLFDMVSFFLELLRMRCDIPVIPVVVCPASFLMNKSMVIILLVSAGNAHINGELCIVSTCELDPLGCKR